ncbi:MAG: hypothetical protein OXI03_09055, partial [Chloroflexota bacterium]|nr:hypothetical protein [Chloroflexota bacterium]
LNGVQLSGPIPSQLGHPPKLEYLYLGSNGRFTGCVPRALYDVPYNDFASLDLRGCARALPPPFPCGNGIAVPNPADHAGLVSDCVALLAAKDPLRGDAPLNWDPGIPIAEWDGITLDWRRRVQTLSLSYVQLTGHIPAELGNLDALVSLHANNNQLRGEIPPELGRLPNLLNVWLHDNRLSGSIPPELGSAPDLRRLWLQNNQLSGPIPPELGSLPQLSDLRLEGNQLWGPIPAELGSLSTLSSLDLSHNQLTGPIPTAFTSLHRLGRLELRGNQLTGTIPAGLGSIQFLSTLDLRDNQLMGTIPPELTGLVYLNGLRLHGNQLTGCIPPALRDAQYNDLHVLGLADCGAPASPPPTCGDGTVVPNIESEPSLARDCAILLASRDALAGDAPLNWDLGTPITAWDGIAVYGSPPRVRRISLEPYDRTLHRTPGSHTLTGHIPALLGGLTALRSLYLSFNELTGPIPPELGNLSDLIHLHVGYNQLTGPIPASLGSLRNLRFLWLSDNELSGAIPAELGSLHDLRFLWLDRNRLTGSIPTTLTALRKLTFLSLQQPSPGFTGCIPPALRDVPNTYLDPLPDCPP